MDLTDQHILLMRTTHEFLTELTSVTHTPNVPESIRHRAQHLLNRYPEMPDATQIGGLDYATNLEPVSKNCSRKKKDRNVLNWVSWYLFSDAKRAQDAIFYAGLVASTLGFGAIILYYSLSI